MRHDPLLIRLDLADCYAMPVFIVCVAMQELYVTHQVHFNLERSALRSI